MPIFILLFLLWVLLSGKVTAEVCLTGAVISFLLSLFSRKVLGYDLGSGKPVLKRLWESIRYLVFLLYEILKASLTVMKLVYTRGKNTEPVLLYFHTALQTEKAKAALADSITLTAGTITVFTENNVFCVHALDETLAEDIENSGFIRRLKEMER